jgi:hypothetical protein
MERRPVARRAERLHAPTEGGVAMSLDHRDDAAVRAFTDEVDEHLGLGESGLEPWTLRLLGAWVLAGALITLAVRTDGGLSTALYLLGFVVVAAWVAGFYAARDDAHWFGR